MGLLGVSILVPVYAYAIYPVLLVAVASLRRSAPTEAPKGWSDDELPTVSITVPAYNEAAQIRQTVESLLRLDYPPEKRQILIVSDASDDGTDEIVREYASSGVELLRMPERVGKTAAENSARSHLTGEVVINTDASIRLDTGAVRALVREFADPTVGVASGRDVSTSRVELDVPDSNLGESGYVGYEMWVRRLETRVYGIVGASGSLYAIRARLNRYLLPEGLSRDFSSALIAREHGLRAVSVDDALAVVPRAPSLRKEYRRKVRTITRGIETLSHRRYLHNPFRYGVFAWMLFSHKICRWLVPWSLTVTTLALGFLALSNPVAGWAFVAARGLLRPFGRERR